MIKILFQWFLFLASPLVATPTSLFWTLCTTDVVPTSTATVSLTDYFKIESRARPLSFSPLDIGLQFGVFSWKDIQAEAGVDYIIGRGTNDLFFNAKIRLQEKALFANAPSMSIGIFNVGTRTHGANRTNQNIVNIVLGKSLPDWIGGRIFIGAFSGSRAMGKNRQGFMVGFTRSVCTAKDEEGNEYTKWAFGADYASGKNTIGGGGCAVTYYFTPNVNLQTGPVWFNSKKINGSWNWSIQLNVNTSIF